MAVQFGEYTRLVLATQADQDPQHRQTAMTELARIAPAAGNLDANGRCPGDAPAAPLLARLYPPPSTEPAVTTTPVPPAIAALMAEAEERVHALIRQHTGR